MNTKTEVKKTFAKIYLKIHIGKKHSNNEFLFLDLIREEIKIIILIIVTKEFDFLLNKIKDNQYLDETVDLVFKLLILSAKNKILTRLKLQPPKSVHNTNLKKNWLLSLISFEDYVAFSLLLTSLTCINSKTNDLQTLSLKFLLEHLILKVSDLLIYDIFVTKKIKLKLLAIYSIDELLLVSYSAKASTYLTWKIYIKSLVPTNKYMGVSIKILTFAKTGIIRRTTIIENPYSNMKLSHLIINRPLKLIERTLLYILHLLAKK